MKIILGSIQNVVNRPVNVSLPKRRDVNVFYRMTEFLTCASVMTSRTGSCPGVDAAVSPGLDKDVAALVYEEGEDEADNTMDAAKHEQDPQLGEVLKQLARRH